MLVADANLARVVCSQVSARHAPSRVINFALSENGIEPTLPLMSDPARARNAIGKDGEHLDKTRFSRMHCTAH